MWYWRPNIYAIMSTLIINMILTHLQYNIDFHMDHNSDMGTNIICFIIKSDQHHFWWQEIDLHCILCGDKLWISCTCNADAHNVNMNNIQCTPWQMEPDLPAATAGILEIPKAAVVTILVTAVAGSRPAAAAAAVFHTPVTVARGHG